MAKALNIYPTVAILGATTTQKSSGNRMQANINVEIKLIYQTP